MMSMMKLKNLYKNNIFKNVILAVFFGVLSYLLGKIQFKIPGFDETTTDLREIPIQISIFYISHWSYYLIISFITSLQAPTFLLFLSTFITHLFPAIFFWFTYRLFISKISSLIKSSFYWFVSSFLYYFVFLFPILTFLKVYIFQILESDYFINLFSIIKSSEFEIITTSVISTLYFMQAKTKITLDEKIKRLNFIKRNTNVSYWTWNIPGNKIIYDENQEYAIIRRQKDEFTFEEFEKNLHEDEADNYKNIITSELKNGSFSIEHRMKNAENEWSWFLSQGKVTKYDSEKKPEICVGLHIDISKIKKATEEKINLELKYKEIFNSTNDGILILDFNTLQINESNKSFSKIIGYSMNEILNSSIDILCDNTSDECSYSNLIENINKSKNGNIFEFEWLSQTKSKERKWIYISAINFSIRNRKQILLVIHDINSEKIGKIELEKYKNNLELLVRERTDELGTTNEELKSSNEELTVQREELENALEKLKKSQDQLIQSEKMASLGILASGVAHEINNPLNFIQGGIHGIQTYIDENIPNHNEELKPLYEAIYTGVERAGNIITSLNHFSRQNNSTDDNCDINKIIENCLVILKNKLKLRIEIIKDFFDENIVLKGNEGRLHQAILNIISNAEQAIEGNGKIFITTKIIEKNITITIQDTGKGISNEIINKITDPFFTTKPAGQGTGLGLSITKKIIEQHNGTITFKSVNNSGALVTIYLPINK